MVRTSTPQRPVDKKKKDDGPKKPSKLAILRDALIKDFNDIGGRRWTAPSTDILRITAEERSIAEAAKRTHAELADIKKAHESMTKNGRNQADDQARMEQHEMDLRYRQLQLERERLEHRKRELAERKGAYQQESDIIARQREQELREDRIRQQMAQENQRFRTPADLPTRGQQPPYVGEMRGASTASPYRNLSRDPFFDPHANLAEDPLAARMRHMDDPLQSVYDHESLRRNNVDDILNRRRAASDTQRPKVLNDFAKKLDARLNPAPKPNIPTNPYLPKENRMEFALQRAAFEREQKMRQSLQGKSPAEQEAIIRNFQAHERLARMSPEERERLSREREAHQRRGPSYLGQDPLHAHYGLDSRARAHPGLGRRPSFDHGVGGLGFDSEHGLGRGGLSFDRGGLGFGGADHGFDRAGLSDPLRGHSFGDPRGLGRSHSPPFGVHHDPFVGPIDDHRSSFPSLGRADPFVSRDSFPSLQRRAAGLATDDRSPFDAHRRPFSAGLAGAGLDSWRRSHEPLGGGLSGLTSDPLARSAPPRSAGIDNVFSNLGLLNSMGGLGTSGISGLASDHVGGSSGLGNFGSDGLGGLGASRSGDTTPGSGAAELLRGMGLGPSTSNAGLSHASGNAQPSVRFAGVDPSPRISPTNGRRPTPGPTSKITSSPSGTSLDRPPTTGPALFSSPHQPPTDLFGTARRNTPPGPKTFDPMTARKQEMDALMRERKAAEAETAALERQADELERKLAEAEKQHKALSSSASEVAPATTSVSAPAPAGEGKKGKKNKGGKAAEASETVPASGPPTVAQGATALSADPTDANVYTAQAILAEISAHSGLRGEDLELVTADEASREAALSHMSKNEQAQLLDRLSRLAPHELEAIRTLEQADSLPKSTKKRNGPPEDIPLAFPEPSGPPPPAQQQQQQQQSKGGKKGGSGSPPKNNFQSTSAAAGFSPAQPPLGPPGSPLHDLQGITFGDPRASKGPSPNAPPQQMKMPEPDLPPPSAAVNDAPAAQPGPGQGKKKKGKGGGDPAKPNGGPPVTGPPTVDYPEPSYPPPSAQPGPPPGAFDNGDGNLLRDFTVIPAGQPIPLPVERFIDHVLTVLPPAANHIDPKDSRAQERMTTMAIQNLIQTAASMGANAIVDFKMGEVEPGVRGCEADAVLLRYD